MRPTPETIDLVRALRLEPEYMRGVVERLAAIGSSHLGFRVAGTPEDRETAELIAGEMRSIGLDDVAVEEVAVDGWRFEGAVLHVFEGQRSFEASSFGGVPPTGPDGVDGTLVDVGTARRRELDRLPLEGRIALVEWRASGVGLAEIGLELGLRGAVGMVASCPAGGHVFQAERALGSFNVAWHRSAPPLLYICREDAAELRSLVGEGTVPARIVLRAEVTPGSPGCNAVGYLSGQRAGPLLLSAHHDGWFRGAFDNATGVAAVLAIARALVDVGYRPDHTICFSSPTGEEYGLLDTDYDGGAGSWGLTSQSHPDWGEAVPFHLCLDASGHPELPLQLHAPEELTSWTRAMCRTGEREGWLAGGWKLSATAAGTDQWPPLLAGIPGIAAYNWDDTFRRTRYHTQHDTSAILDFDRLANLARLYACIALEADRDPDGILDHSARERAILKSLDKLGGLAATDGIGEAADTLRAAAREHGARSGRGAFTVVGRHLHAIRSDGAVGYPHEQAAHDASLLRSALDALRAGERGRALRFLRRVSGHAIVPYVSDEAFAIRTERLIAPRAGSWAEQSQPTRMPNLWKEITALRGKPGAPEAGKWIERSVEAELERLQAEVRERLLRAAQALS